jgi:hypothetical protein
VYPELPVNQHLRKIFSRSCIQALLLFCSVLPLFAQAQKPNLPDPIKFNNKFDQVANMVRVVFEDMGLSIELDDRKGGRITSRPYEFITGSLTPNEVEKVAIIKNTLTGNWIKAQHSLEAILEIVSPTTTMVTMHASVEALNRDVDGTEKWVQLDSLGTIERRALGRLSIKLLGNDAPATERKGFWGRKPQPVDPRQPRFFTDPTR